MTKTNKAIPFIIFLTGMGTFFSGFVYWMSSSSANRAEIIKKNGVYQKVEIAKKYISKGVGRNPTDNYYLKVVITDAKKPIDLKPIRIGENNYFKLKLGQKVNAWIYKRDVSLDYGRKNAREVANTMAVVCMAFALVFMSSVIYKVKMYFID